jgi:hypothetical protein
LPQLDGDPEDRKRDQKERQEVRKQDHEQPTWCQYSFYDFRLILANFGEFWQIYGEKIGDLLEKQCYDLFLPKYVAVL